jgi:hypothetical protein
MVRSSAFVYTDGGRYAGREDWTDRADLTYLTDRWAIRSTRENENDYEKENDVLESKVDSDLRALAIGPDGALRPAQGLEPAKRQRPPGIAVSAT